MIIRPYRPEDSAAIARITKEAWAGVTMAELRERQFGQIGGTPWYEQKAQGIVHKCQAHPELAFVAEEDGQVVGYATYGLSHNGDVGIVGDNAVDPAWQGRGIGTALVRHVRDTLIDKGVKMLEVTTFVHDAAARRVYERLGFVEIARSVHYTMAPVKK